MTKRLKELKRHLRPGEVYTRNDLSRWSRAVDRHVNALLGDGTLNKLSAGIYHYPKESVFGLVPAEDKKLVEKFLKDDRFLLTSRNEYNSLGVGTTQLYNENIVYNHKRHGQFELGGRRFDFRVKPHFPKRLNQEFLLVDLVNNLDDLAEDKERVLLNVKRKCLELNSKELHGAIRNFGSMRTKKLFRSFVFKQEAQYAI